MCHVFARLKWLSQISMISAINRHGLTFFLFTEDQGVSHPKIVFYSTASQRVERAFLTKNANLSIQEPTSF